ncbi:MAG: hypothetical protein COB10_09440 [Planctomycetota bacterium]|nr:MAG: hypothetical protein COB10_09440 [Planctomycetota bacterium]
MGLAHTGGLVNLTAIEAGAVTAASNGGAGPDFEFTDVNPAGGPGGTYGVILSFGAPLDEIPVGSGNEIALFNYNCAASAEPGSVRTLDFSDALGSPPVATIISIVSGTTSASRIPIKVSGSVSVGTPAPSGLTCSVLDPCAGGSPDPGSSSLVQLSWTNEGTYDEVQVIANSNPNSPVQVLAGTATSTTLVLPVDNFVFIVLGVRNTVVSADSNSCGLNIVTTPVPDAPTGVTCSVDQVTGDTTVNWTNSGTVSAVDVSINGTLAATLGAGSTSAVVTIGGPGSYNICVRGANECGEFGAESCCTAVRDNFFIRNDMNQDGGSNIADPVAALNYLFGGGVLACLKSGDVNDDGSVNIADVVFSLNVIFGIPSGGSVPTVPDPAGACGPDPTPDALTCDSFNGCP